MHYRLYQAGCLRATRVTCRPLSWPMGTPAPTPHTSSSHSATLHIPSGGNSGQRNCKHTQSRGSHHRRAEDGRQGGVVAPPSEDKSIHLSRCRIHRKTAKLRNSTTRGSKKHGAEVSTRRADGRCFSPKAGSTDAEVSAPSKAKTATQTSENVKNPGNVTSPKDHNNLSGTYLKDVVICNFLNK
ncbi:hypothetical protein HJG60_010365 [Phyllostomus discolor]|uniref:Uncharacterized protein n=1 Tax=Phyllostomus discolor TaxID=89673 RepID=A0A834AWR6_9CHIR|nr:hypothetical protein HJG60_010365 [Phyllostomus discolor]